MKHTKYFEACPKLASTGSQSLSNPLGVDQMPFIVVLVPARSPCERESEHKGNPGTALSNFLLPRKEDNSPGDCAASPVFPLQALSTKPFLSGPARKAPAISVGAEIQIA